MRAPVAVGLAAVAGAAYLGLSDPYRPGGHVVCPVYALTGFYCAGCGGQRAVHELVQGDVAAAWGMNPLVVLVAPLAVLAWLRWLGRAGRATSGSRPTPGWVPWLVVSVVAGFAVLRNVPLLSPWLAP